MVKLSILIAAGDAALLEATLVSVLQNRPADCELVVVRDETYGDPYDLAGEVRYVVAPRAANLLARLNRGLGACTAPIVHVLGSGAEVEEGWTAAPLAHFADARVAAVAPLVVAHGCPTQVEAAGLQYRRGGVRVARLHKRPVASISGTPEPILGPTLNAAFYRKTILRALGEVLSQTVGIELADVDLALRLEQAGHIAMFNPRSRVIAPPAVRRRNPLAEAWLAERLFWRHARAHGRLGAMAHHAGVVAVESALSLVNPLQASRLIGRAAGFVEQLWRGQPACEVQGSPSLQEGKQDQACIPFGERPATLPQAAAAPKHRRAA